MDQTSFQGLASAPRGAGSVGESRQYGIKVNPMFSPTSLISCNGRDYCLDGQAARQPVPFAMPRKVDAAIHRPSTLEYWRSTPATDDGMLDNLSKLSPADLAGSTAFLASLRANSKAHPPSRHLRRVVDCGAGIGRVTLGFLSNVSDTVDIVEPVDKFTAEIELGDAFRELRQSKRLGKIYKHGVEAFEPEPATYDLIWNQWCLLYLKDTELVRYLQRCKAGLTDGGWLVVKENVITDKGRTDMYDEVDSSVTRTDRKYRSLFGQAGLKLVASETQTDWPDELYPVVMYALQPL